MTYFAINLVLALVWAGLMGSFSLSSLLVGYAMGYFILLAFSYGSDSSGYLRRIPSFLSFVVYYLIELVRANLQIAIDLMRVTPQFRPGFVRVPLDLKTDVEITLLANLITMTPGTLTVDVSEDRTQIFVHGLYIHDEESVCKDIKQNLEQRIIQLLRANPT